MNAEKLKKELATLLYKINEDRNRGIILGFLPLFPWGDYGEKVYKPTYHMARIRNFLKKEDVSEHKIMMFEAVQVYLLDIFETYSSKVIDTAVGGRINNIANAKRRLDYLIKLTIDYGLRARMLHECKGEKCEDMITDVYYGVDALSARKLEICITFLENRLRGVSKTDELNKDIVVYQALYTCGRAF